MSKTPEPLEKTAKIIIIGDSGAGKTSLLVRFCQETFYEQVKTTIGLNYLQKLLEIDGKKIKLQVWDTAGQEKYKSITQTFFHGAQGVIFTYSIDSRESFHGLERWMTMVKNNDRENIPKVIVGNKNDHDQQNRVVTLKEGQEFAKQHQIKFFETSAKDNLNVNEVFETIAKDIKVAIFDKDDVNPTPNTNVTLDKDKKKTQGSGCCGGS